jgi:predicted PurR-regulated permease PerM
MANAAESRAALLLVAAGLAVAIAGVFPLAAGLLAAPALAVICRPLQGRWSAHVGPRIAALSILVLVWVVLVVPSVWLTTLAIQQVPDALHEVQHAVAELRVRPAPLPGLNVDTLVARVSSSSLGWVSSTVGPALGAIAHGLVDLSIALLGLYFLLVAGDEPWRVIREHLPFSADGSEALRDVFVNVTRATLLGTLSSAALQGFSIGLGLRFIGNSAPAFWGIVAGFTTLVPVVGNAIVWVPAVVAQVVHRQFGNAVLMLVFGKLVPALLDRLLRTAISRRVGNTHPMVTLLGALAGVRLVGAVGVLIGPTIVQCSLALVGVYDREYGVPWARRTEPCDEQRSSG